MRKLTIILIIFCVLFNSGKAALNLELNEDVCMSYQTATTSTLRHCALLSEFSTTLVKKYFDADDIAITQISQDKQNTASAPAPKKTKQNRRADDLSIMSSFEKISKGLTSLKTAGRGNSSLNTYALVIKSLLLEYAGLHNYLLFQSYFYLLLAAVFLLLPRSKIEDTITKNLIYS